MIRDVQIYLGMETPLRGRSGGHTGTAPTFSFGRLRVDDWFCLCGMCGKILRSVVGGGAYVPARVALQGRIRRSSPAHNASIFGMETPLPARVALQGRIRRSFLAHDACVVIMETPLRGRSGGHAGTAPAVLFGWIVHGTVDGVWVDYV